MPGEYQKITEDQIPLPGDYIKYIDRWGKPIGSGVLLKTIINERKPLTESYYVLKNMSKNKTWRIRCDQYEIWFMRHRPRNCRLADYLRELVSNEEKEF